MITYIKNKLSEIKRMSTKCHDLWLLCDTPQQYLNIINIATQNKDGESVLDMYIQGLKNKKLLGES